MYAVVHCWSTSYTVRCSSSQAANDARTDNSQRGLGVQTGCSMSRAPCPVRWRGSRRGVPRASAQRHGLHRTSGYMDPPGYPPPVLQPWSTRGPPLDPAIWPTMDHRQIVQFYGKSGVLACRCTGVISVKQVIYVQTCTGPCRITHGLATLVCKVRYFGVFQPLSVKPGQSVPSYLGP